MRPTEKQVVPIFIGQQERNFGILQPLTKGVEGEGYGNGNVETFGESVHGKFEKIIGQANNFARNPFAFVSKKQGDGLFEWEGFWGIAAPMRGGSYDAVAF